MNDFKQYNNIAGIYKWQNKTNGKCYIGLSVNLGSRLRHHMNNYKHHRYDAPLYKAFDKYGIDSFDIEILYSIEHPTNNIKPFLDRLEIGYIEKYNSYGKTGYNLTRGGDAGILGYKFTEEQRKKVSYNSKKNAENITKPAFLYDIITKQIFIFSSFMSSAKALNTSHSQVSRLCHQKQLLLNNRFIGALNREDLMQRIKYAEENVELICKHKKTKGMRKRPTSGLKRHFNTLTGKKILTEEHKNKIRNSLFKYKVLLYKDGELYKEYETTKDLNDDLFHYLNHQLALKTVTKYIKRGWKYRKLYEFKLIDKKTTNLNLNKHDCKSKETKRNSTSPSKST